MSKLPTRESIERQILRGCATPLGRVCAGRGSELRPTAKFCDECGASTVVTPPAVPEVRRVADYTPKHLADKTLQSKSALEGERKQVTVLFADIQGSMQLATHLDPEQWHQLVERYFAILTEVMYLFQGTVNQYTGDGIMALFGAPIAHEDHARRACYAVLQERDQLRAFADELRLTQGLNFSFRIGMNSGDVVVGKIGDDLRMDYTAQGATVGIAQRIEQLAAYSHPCQHWLASMKCKRQALTPFFLSAQRTRRKPELQTAALEIVLKLALHMRRHCPITRRQMLYEGRMYRRPNTVSPRA